MSNITTQLAVAGHDFMHPGNPHGLRFVEGDNAPAGDPPPNPAPQPPANGPQRPDGVSEAEWTALGDPGKNAIVRERARAVKAEQDLAAARSAPPKAPAPPPDPPKTPTPNDGQPDLAQMIQDAVSAAVAPFQQRDQEREANEAASAIRTAVLTAATDLFHDTEDALSIDLPSLTDGNGRPDDTKIQDALKNLLTRKPHLGKPADLRRRTPVGAPVGASGGASPSLDDRTKAALERMQQSSGVKFSS